MQPKNPPYQPLKTHQAELFRKGGFDSVAIFNQGGKCVEVNDMLLATFSLNKSDIINQPLKFFLGNQDLQNIPHEFHLLRRERETFQCKVSCNNISFPALIQCKKINILGTELNIVNIRNITRSQSIRKKLEATHAELDTIFANSMVGISLVSADRTIIRANNFFSETLGYGKPKNIEGMPARELYLDQKAFDQFGEKYEEILRNNKKIEIEAFFRKKDGSPILGKIVGSAIDQNDLNKGVIWISEDITLKRETENRLQEAHNELATIFNNSLIGIVVLKNGRIIHNANQRLAEILGYDSPSELIGKEASKMHLDEESSKFFAKRYYDKLIEDEQLQVDFQFKKRDGSAIWLSLSGKALDKAYPPDLNKGVLWMAEDASKRKAAEERLYRLAHTDELTGIHNRRNFFALAHAELERSHLQDSHISILMLDIDHFKHVNDSLGHSAGDQTLKLFCLVCEEKLQKENIFGRLGGEEFAIILAKTSEKQAEQRAEQIREAVASDPRFKENALPQITVSIGVATAKGSAANIDNLLICADKRLYRAKSQGRNRVVSRSATR